MTIPQGENRGPQSISERRKVPYTGDSPGAGQQPTKATSTDSALSEEDTGSVSAVNTVKDTTNTEEESPDSTCDSLVIEDESVEAPFQELRSQCLYNSKHVEVNVTVVSPTDSKKSSLPLLSLLKSDGASLSFDKSRKLSLTLTKPFGKQYPELKHLEKTRRFSQPQKSSYQRVPQEDPSPLSPVSEIFTLQQLGQDNRGFKHRQNSSAHSSDVEASVRLDTVQKDVKFAIQSSSLESSTSKKLHPGKHKTLTSKSSSSFRSVDDLALFDHGGGLDKPKSFSASRSASSEDLPAFRKKVTAGSGNNDDNNHPRRQAGVHYSSTTSPSHCCLVSVSRVPMAAATSHLTLDSDYQTVRLAVLGAPGVGKSSIVRQFVMQQFMEEYVPTEQRQIFCPAVIINEHLYEVRIIDCPYIPYFPVNSLYEWTDFRGYGLRNATAYVLVYDITSEESFEYIKSLRLQILESRNRHDVPIFVVGNKHDLAEERGVPRREVREISNLVKKQWKCGYIECSAKYNWHIMLLFKELMKTVDYIDYGHKPTSMRVQDALRRNRCLIL